MDLVCITPGVLGFVYKTHLPLLGWAASINEKMEKTEKTQKDENERDLLKMKREGNHVIPTEKANKKQRENSKGQQRGIQVPKKTKELKQSKISRQDSKTSSGGDERFDNTLHSEVRASVTIFLTHHW